MLTENNRHVRGIAMLRRIHHLETLNMMDGYTVLFLSQQIFKPFNNYHFSK